MQFNWALWAPVESDSLVVGCSDAVYVIKENNFTDDKSQLIVRSKEDF